MDSMKKHVKSADMSLRSALAVSTVVSAALGVTAAMALNGWTDELRGWLMEPYLEDYQVAPGVMTKIVVESPEGLALFWSNFGGLITLALTAFIIAGSILAQACFFYKWKLKKPLEALNKASEKISANNLDFEVPVYSEDELGRLCRSFELMRASLEENYRIMWRSVEERKRLNAAFSHDLRTPLTVLRGYTDLLAAYLPGGEYSQDKLLKTVNSMGAQVDRLERYTESMGALQRLEDVDCSRRQHSFRELATSLKESAEIVCQGFHLGLDFRAEHRLDRDRGRETEETEGELWADRELISQVFENMISNAVRFVEADIRVLCGLDAAEMQLVLAVTDDGPGFSEEGLVRAGDPFFRGRACPRADGGENGVGHFGLGLYICTLLCEKHGGFLSVENTGQGGARVTARFHCSPGTGETKVQVVDK